MSYIAINRQTLHLTKFATLLEATSFVDIEWGKDCPAIVAPVEARSFSSLTDGEARTLLRNLTGDCQYADYAKVLQALKNHAQEMPIPFYEHSEIMPEKKETPVRVIPPKEVADPVTVINTPKRPKGGVTLQVWEIADSVFVEGRPFNVMRGEIIEACVKAGIDKSTAATQYSKWRASKTSEQMLALSQAVKVQ